MHTSFNILTLALMPANWSSFWLSSSLNTASEYCPREFGVAGLYAAAPGLRLGLPPPPPGYAEKAEPFDALAVG
jgi:hypothetical protein